MTIPERFWVAPIKYRVAMNIVTTRHYAKRTAPCSIALGLFDHKDNDRLVGVITYGKSASTTLRTGLCGPDEADDVIELTRLWVEDGTPRNTESYFIRQSLRWVKDKIIVSFADSSITSDDGKVVQHRGYVYQASNFLYCGLSQKFTDPKHVDFPNQHHTSWAKACADKSKTKTTGTIVCVGCGAPIPKNDFKLMKGVIEKYGWVCEQDHRLSTPCGHGSPCGGKVYMEERPRKHRYVLFNTPKRRRRALAKKLRYPVVSYPK